MSRLEYQLSESKWRWDRVMAAITQEGLRWDPPATQAQVGRPVVYRPDFPDGHRREVPDPTPRFGVSPPASPATITTTVNGSRLRRSGA